MFIKVNDTYVNTNYIRNIAVEPAGIIDTYKITILMDDRRDILYGTFPNKEVATGIAENLIKKINTED